MSESAANSSDANSDLTSASVRFANLIVKRTKMNLSVGTPILCVLLVVLLSETAHSRPADNWPLSRQKRLSDQRLAELETLLALQNVKGVVVPVGFGKVNPAILGRKRRSITEDDLRKLRHLLLLIAQDAESTADNESDRIRLLQWKEDPREEQRDYQLI